MAAIIGILIALLCLVVLAIPFLKARYHNTLLRDSGDSDRDAEIRAVFSEMERLKLDRDVGYLTDQEYTERLHPLRLAAADLLRKRQQPDAAPGQSQPIPHDLDQRIEDAITSLRLKSKAES
ncbi:MAG: hypothetical protein FJ320_02910 [SAR202 cluster bacterium]|nr:hypothetical protein [SAR202 cluster bacterium]